MSVKSKTKQRIFPTFWLLKLITWSWRESSDYVILLDISVSPSRLLRIGGVQISDLVPVHESSCNMILDKESSLGDDSNK